MGYYIRVLGTTDQFITIKELETAAKANGKKVGIRIEQGEKENWTQISAAHLPEGPEIMLVEKNPVTEGELGVEELQEFIDELPNYEPGTAASWLRSYLPQVKVIYAFQLLSGTDVLDGWSIVHNIQSAIWRRIGGILQADGEGFSNEEGYTILWQFSDNAKGLWRMAVLNQQGKWTAFEMELGNLEQRESFLKGEVPPGVRLL